MGNLNLHNTIILQMTEKRFLTEADFPEINRIMMGWNTIDDSGFLKVINPMIRRDKWTVQDVKVANAFIKDGARCALDYIFLKLNRHPHYIKLYGDVITESPPISRQEYSRILSSGTAEEKKWLTTYTSYQ